MESLFDEIYVALNCAAAGDKLRILQDQPLRIAHYVKIGEIRKTEAFAKLCNVAQRFGLYGSDRRQNEDTEHVIRGALEGREMLPRIPVPASKSGPIKANQNSISGEAQSPGKTDSSRNANGEGKNPRASNGGATLVSRCAADVAPEKIEWLWPGRIARGKHTCIAGEPGTGKSQLTVAIIAAVTTGGAWPCGEGRAPIGNVIILSAEDGAADTIIPRLIAAGADRNRVDVVSAVRNPDGSRRTVNLQNDLDLLAQMIAKIGNVALVVIDPVSSYLGKTDSHKNSEVRGVLEPVSEMAERTRVAILSVTHFSKAGANTVTKALHRFIGSIAFTGAPRVAFAVIEDAEQDGRRLFLHAKNNLAAPPQGLAFRLEQRLVGDGIVASRVVWDNEPVTITANEALAAESVGTETRTSKAEAIAFLQAALADGPVPAAEVNRMARDHGLTAKAVRSAREALGIKIERDGFGSGSKSIWSLPTGA